jgi:hypothetical protein
MPMRMPPILWYQFLLHQSFENQLLWHRPSMVAAAAMLAIRGLYHSGHNHLIKVNWMRVLVSSSTIQQLCLLQPIASTIPSFLCLR